MARRAKQAEQTRRRIVTAALDVFARNGAKGLTMTAVARSADVSPATVTNHFATPDELLEAVVAQVVADVEVPDAGIFAATRSLAGRLRALTEAMYGFFERTESWFRLLGSELSEVPALARAEKEFWQAMQELYAEALAGAQDDRLAKVTAGLLHPATYGALTAAGLSPPDASSVVGELLTHQARRGRR